MSARFTPGAAASLRLSGDGVLLLKWAAKLSIGAGDAEAAMALINELCQGVARPVLVDMAGTTMLSRGACAVFTRPSCATRIALLGDSHMKRIIVNFLLSLSTAPCPVRFFTTRDKALQWLLDPAS
jgi:hypothetical protein